LLTAYLNCAFVVVSESKQCIIVNLDYHLINKIATCVCIICIKQVATNKRLNIEEMCKHKA